ncbi:MAG: sulfatase-like hydrolase/transferase, partial [Candidatus Marinimicrobia bacterium]|nr:sulfatase-like hydrolase/transferase [Candidatus Neomarinimicrobiota bacterium]
MGRSTLPLLSTNSLLYPFLTKDRRPNILFIAVDDLRPQLNCYGHQQMISPNIDRLAAQGMIFRRAYCQVPVCGASRASLLMGRRPTRSRFLDFTTRADVDCPNELSLPGYLKANGYHTISNGKIFHHKDDYSGSWSELPWRPQGDWAKRGYLSEVNKKYVIDNKGAYGSAYENADVPDNVYSDGKVTDKSITDLRKLKNTYKPFFLGVGYLKPH